MNAQIDVTAIRLETPRLILRPWREEDLQDFYEYARVDGVGQMAGWIPHKNIEKSREILNAFIGHKKTLALELRDSGKTIGSIGIEEFKEEECPEIPQSLYGRELGYVLSKAYWGQGLMPEAVRAAIDYCFQVLNYDFLTCGHFAWNNQSRRVIEKSGFQFLKDISYTTRMGTVEPTKLYILYNSNKKR